MADLLVIAFPTETQAERGSQKLLAMQSEYLIELGDAVVVVKDAEGSQAQSAVSPDNCGCGLRRALGHAGRASS